MISTFNLAKLRLILKDFYYVTNIQITIFSDTFEVITAYPDTPPAFCSIIRSDSNAFRRCLECDKAAIDIACSQKSAYVYQCHAGLTESITPLFTGNITIGYIYMAATSTYSSYSEGWETVRNLCCDYKIDFEKLEKTFYEKPLLEKSYLHSCAQIMNTVASYLCLEQLAYVRKEDLIVRIDAYINENISNSLDIENICQHFNIGKTHLYNLSIQYYGTGIAKHIRDLRIKKAKNLLTQNPELNITAISDACGFTDYNNFISLFKRTTGFSPQKYRKAKLI